VLLKVIDCFFSAKFSKTQTRLVSASFRSVDKSRYETVPSTEVAIGVHCCASKVVDVKINKLIREYFIFQIQKSK
jgi:hypothetical protein